jgi:hypothetical protein
MRRRRKGIPDAAQIDRSGSRWMHSAGCGRFGVFFSALFLFAGALCAGQTPRSPQAAQAPETPRAGNQSKSAAAPSPAAASLGPCQLRNAGAAAAARGAASAIAAAGFSEGAGAGKLPAFKPVSCPPYIPVINWYARFLNGPQVKPLTAKEKAWLAVRNVTDPFNLLTILGEAGISVASNSHTPYGPGFLGVGRNSEVSLGQDATGEFFGTFVIPAIFHQDPHYHRMPKASIKRRVFHAIDQVVWTQGDNGRMMVNYADLVGFAIDGEISDLYVPGQRTNLGATAERYATGLATAPIGNFITEFLPDVARHIHVRVVLVQRIINRVAVTSNAP